MNYRIDEWNLPHVNINSVSGLYKINSTQRPQYRCHSKMICIILKHLNDFNLMFQLSPAQFSHSVMSTSLQPHGFCPLPTPGLYSNSCPLSQWCHPTISSSIVPMSSHLQSFPASGNPVIQFFILVGQNIRELVSASVLPMNTKDWSPLGWTGWIFLLSKGLSRVFSKTTVQKHQFFSTHLPL